MTRQLLILGASVRAATQSAVQAHFRVTAADIFADRDLAAMAECVQVQDYPDGLLAIRQRFPNLPVMYTGALENYPDLIDQLATTGPLWGNSGATLRAVRDPFHLHEIFTAHQIQSPQLSRTPPATDEHEWLQKAFRSAGGQHVTHHRAATVASGSHYYQQLVHGTPCSAAFVASGQAAQLLGVTNMLVGEAVFGAAGFVYCGSISRTTTATERQQWQHMGSVLTEELKLTGVFGIDAIDAGAEILPIEVNPRFTASMEILAPLEPQHSIVATHVAASTMHELPDWLTASTLLQRLASDGDGVVDSAVDSGGIASKGKAILYAKQDVVVPDEWTVLDDRFSLADLPYPGQRVAQHHPILTLITESLDHAHILPDLRQGAEAIYRQLLPVANRRAAEL